MKNWLIIGSTAQYHWFPDSRVPQDLDLLTPASFTGSDSKVCIIDTQYHEMAEQIIGMNKDKVFIDPDLLFTLKVSHAHWDVHWEKTMFDVQFLQNKGCTLNLELYQQLIPVWTRIHGKKAVQMNQPCSVFFKDAVHRVIPHDDLHELVKFTDQPMHVRIRPDHENVWCSEALFNSLTPDEQAYTALEEIMVTGIERSHLTSGSAKSEQQKAMAKSLKALCTSMTKGWFARYLILNQNNLLHKRKLQWMPNLTSALQNLPSSP